MEVSANEIGASCRACLSTTENLESLFATLTEDSQPLNEILLLVTPDLNSIELNDGLAQGICESCRIHAINAYKFQEMCRANDKHVRQLLMKFDSIKEEVDGLAGKIDSDVLMSDLKPLDEEFESETLDNYDEEDEDDDDEEDSSVTSENKKFSCDSCELQFKSEQKLEDHITNEHQDEESSEGDNEAARIFSCDMCSKKFKKPSLLARHIKTHDPNKRPHECSKCQKRFPSQVSLVRHDILHSELVERSKINRPEPQDFSCVICGRTFKSSELLGTHLKSHKSKSNNDDEYSCKLCHDVFPTFTDIIRHSKNHIENATHQCAICNKLFVVGDELIDHFLRHKGMKPHQCPVCEKSFLKLHKLNVHMRTHSDDKVRKYSMKIKKKLIKDFL